MLSCRLSFLFCNTARFTMNTTTQVHNEVQLGFRRNWLDDILLIVVCLKSHTPSQSITVSEFGCSELGNG